MHSARSCREAQKGGAKGRRKGAPARPRVVFYSGTAAEGAHRRARHGWCLASVPRPTPLCCCAAVRAICSAIRRSGEYPSPVDARLCVHRPSLTGRTRNRRGPTVAQWSQSLARPHPAPLQTAESSADVRGQHPCPVPGPLYLRLHMGYASTCRTSHHLLLAPATAQTHPRIVP